MYLRLCRCCEKAYNQAGFTKTEKRLFGTGNYKLALLSEPSEAFQVTTNYGAWVPIVQRISFKINKVWSPIMTPISTY
jgi:hypothetical protein